MAKRRRSGCRPRNPWRPEEDAVLLRIIAGAPTVQAGCREAARVLGRTVRACESRYGKRLAKRASASGFAGAEAELVRLVRLNGRLTKEDLEGVARKSGLHYHEVLSLLGSLYARGLAGLPCPGCSEVEALRAKVAGQAAELEELRAKASEAEALRARVAELEARLGVGLDPLSVKLTYDDETLAGLGATSFVGSGTPLHKRLCYDPRWDEVFALLLRLSHFFHGFEYVMRDALGAAVQGEREEAERQAARVRKNLAWIAACVEKLLGLVFDIGTEKAKVGKEKVLKKEVAAC